jgi:hypothetical protein
MTAMTTTPVTRLADAARDRLGAEIARSHEALAAVLQRPSMSRLDAGERGRLRASVEGDRAVLAGLAAEMAAASSLGELRRLRTHVWQLRSEVYDVALAHLAVLELLAEVAEANVAGLARLAAAVADLVADVDVRAVLCGDLREARRLNAAAILGASAVRDGVLHLTARTSQAELVSVADRVLDVTACLDRVDQLTCLVELGLARPHRPGSSQGPRPPMTFSTDR